MRRRDGSWIYDANNAKVQVETVFVQKVFGIWPGAVNSFHVKCLFQPRGPAMCIKYSQTTALHHNFVMFLTFAKCYYSLLYIYLSQFSTSVSVGWACIPLDLYSLIYTQLIVVSHQTKLFLYIYIPSPFSNLICNNFLYLW